MRFLLASLHRAGCQTLVAADSVLLDSSWALGEVTCPRCGIVYVADLALDVDPWDVVAHNIGARVRLDGECPDHAHQFLTSD